MNQTELIMDRFEMERKFKQLFREADYQTKKKINQEIHRCVAKNKSDEQRKHAFFKAVKTGNLRAVENILNEDDIIDVNLKDEKLGNTALIYAITHGHSSIMNLLLDSGADPMIENYKGKNSLDAAGLAKNTSEIISLINKSSN